MNATLTPTLTYVVYADIYIGSSKLTVSEEVTLFASSDEYSKIAANSTLAVNPNEEIVKAIPKISNTMSSSEALTAATLISELTNDVTIGSGIKANNATKSNNDQAIQAANKPVILADGTVSLPPQVLCNDEFCNFKGYCVQLNRFKRDCRCLPKYSGSNCQISQENKKKFDELASNLTSSLLARLNVTSTDSNSALQNVNSEKFQTISTLASSVSLMNPSSAIIKDLTSSVALSIKDFKDPLVAKEILKNNATIISTMNTLMSSLVQVTEQKKYEKLESDYKQGKVDATKISVIPVDFTKNDVTGFSSASPSNAANNSTNNPKNRRVLQTINDNTPANNFILQPSSDYIMSLSVDQVAELRSNYLNILSTLNNINVALINGAKPDAIEFSGSTTYYDYVISSIKDINNYSFQTYFANRKANQLSYFDASDCLKSFISANSASKIYDFNTIYFTYYYFTYPTYSFDTDLSSKALSLSHSIRFYDANAAELPISSCTNYITHYLPIFPNNKDFMTRFNLYPQKYYNEPQYNLGKNYMPYYIFMNGTVDNKNPVELQKDMYYRQYRVNLTSYDSTNNVFYNDANSNFNYLNSNGYSISTSKSTGEFTIFTSSDPVTVQLNNTYFMNYNQIFNIGENYRGNASWYTVILQLGFFLIALVLAILLKTVLRKYSNDNAWFEYENSQLLKDSQVFGDDRYVFFGDNYSNHLMSVNSEEIMQSIPQSKKEAKEEKENLAKNKLYKLQKEEDLKDNEENKGEEGNIVVRDYELDRKANVEGGDQNENMQNAKLRVDGKSEEVSDSNRNANKQEYSKTFSSSNNKISVNTNKRIYNIFYFIGLRNIYASLILLSSPFNPKYKTLSKFALFVWLHMMITVVLFVFAPFKFNVSFIFLFFNCFRS